MISIEPSTPDILWSILPVPVPVQFCFGLVDGDWSEGGGQRGRDDNPFILLVRIFFPRRGSDPNIQTPVCGFVTRDSRIYSLVYCPRLNPVSLTLPGRGPDVGGRRHPLETCQHPRGGDGEGRRHAAQRDPLREPWGQGSRPPSPHLFTAAELWPPTPHAGHSTSPRPFAPLHAEEPNSHFKGLQQLVR